MNETNNFKLIDTIYAWISLIAGYVFCRVFPVNENPLGGFIFMVVLFIVTTIILVMKGYHIKAPAILAAVSALVVMATLIISSNSFLYFFAYMYGLITFCYYIFAGTGNSLEQGFSDLIFVDYFKTLFVMPFCSFGHLFIGLFKNTRRGNGKFVLKLLIGIALAIIPTAIILNLLSYDENFSEIIKKIFSFDFATLWSHFVSFNLAIPIGMYIFGLFSSSAKQKCSTKITADSCNTAYQKVKIAPAITILAAIIPMIFVYVVFFISQWDYYISGFTGILPEEFSYAEYAREGFFQLCVVSVINLVIILLVVVFMRRKDNRPPMLLKLITVVFAVFTLVLISTALSKMFMYIRYYGLTQKRVYSTWLMGVIAIIFVIIIVKQFIPKFKALVTSFAVCVSMFATLGIVNVDTFIARYNVDRYIEGTIDRIDVDALQDLGDSAIPEIIRLAYALEDSGETDSDLYKDVSSALEFSSRMLEIEPRDVWSYSLPYIRAKEAIENYF